MPKPHIIAGQAFQLSLRAQSKPGSQLLLVKMYQIEIVPALPPGCASLRSLFLLAFCSTFGGGLPHTRLVPS